MQIQVHRNDPSGSNKHRHKIKAIRRSATFCCGYKERGPERAGENSCTADLITLEPLKAVASGCQQSGSVLLQDLR